MQVYDEKQATGPALPRPALLGLHSGAIDESNYLIDVTLPPYPRYQDSGAGNITSIFQSQIYMVKWNSTRIGRLFGVTSPSLLF